jgi:hypothetical protein
MAGIGYRVVRIFITTTCTIRLSLYMVLNPDTTMKGVDTAFRVDQKNCKNSHNELEEYLPSDPFE